MPRGHRRATEADANYMIDYDVDKANALLDEMGMKRGADGMRTFRDGSPFTILWEYSSQFANAQFAKLMTDYLKAVGLNVNPKELTSEATRENAKAGRSDINMEWDVPYEPTLIAGLFILLMLLRIAHWRGLPLGSPLVLAAVAVLAALATAAVEFAWYGLATGVPPGRVLAANLQFSFSVRPAWWVLATGLGAAAAAAASSQFGKPNPARRGRKAARAAA